MGCKRVVRISECEHVWLLLATKFCGFLLVLAHVVPFARSLSFSRYSHVPRPREILKVPAPGDALRVQHIDYRRHVLGYFYDIVMVEAEVVATDGGQVVGLRGVGVRVVLRQGDTVSFEVGKLRVENDFGVVLQVQWSVAAKKKEQEARARAYLVLEPYRDEAVEGLPALLEYKLLASAHAEHRGQGAQQQTE